MEFLGGGAYVEMVFLYMFPHSMHQIHDTNTVKTMRRTLHAQVIEERRARAILFFYRTNSINER